MRETSEAPLNDTQTHHTTCTAVLKEDNACLVVVTTYVTYPCSSIY
jgi:hypothetical protein